jgi:hypothetical protein
LLRHCCLCFVSGTANRNGFPFISIRAKSTQDLGKIKRVASFGTKREALVQYTLSKSASLEGEPKRIVELILSPPGLIFNQPCFTS